MPTPLSALASDPGPSLAHRRVSQRPAAPSGSDRDSFSRVIEARRREEPVRTTPDADTAAPEASPQEPRASGNGDLTSKPSGSPAQRLDQGAQEQPPAATNGEVPGGLIVNRFPEFPLGEDAPAPLPGGPLDPESPVGRPVQSAGPFPSQPVPTPGSGEPADPAPRPPASGTVQTEARPDASQIASGDSPAGSRRAAAQGEGEADARGGREGGRRPASAQDAAPPRLPALGRAVQVQAAVGVENVAGQALATEPAGSSTLRTSLDAQTATRAPAFLEPQTATDGNGDRFAGRVLRGLSAVLNQRGGVMTMRLDPPELGQLRIQMTIARGMVTAEFHPTTAQAQALLDQSLATLRTALEAQGLGVERLTVQAIQPSAAQAMRQDAAGEEPHSQRHHPDAAQGESRGRRDEEHHTPSGGEHGELGVFDLPDNATP